MTDSEGHVAYNAEATTCTVKASALECQAVKILELDRSSTSQPRVDLRLVKQIYTRPSSLFTSYRSVEIESRPLFWCRCSVGSSPRHEISVLFVDRLPGPFYLNGVMCPAASGRLDFAVADSDSYG